MPYSDIEVRRLIHRANQRTRVHGNWRQIVIDCGGQCIICGESEHLEFHEQFGEDHHDDGRMQQRVLMCPDCHDGQHPERFHTKANPFKSRLMDDINWEIKRCGGYSAWVAMYMLDDSTWGNNIRRTDD